jgi:hypothetical protein
VKALLQAFGVAHLRVYKVTTRDDVTGAGSVSHVFVGRHASWLTPCPYVAASADGRSARGASADDAMSAYFERFYNGAPRFYAIEEAREEPPAPGGADHVP